MSSLIASDTHRSLSPIIVLGMHRSGTSYLASVVGAIGVNIGTSLLEAAPDNPRGYFEDKDFVEFQADVLTRVLPAQGAGSSLGNILARDIDRIELTSEERARAERLTTMREGQRFWGWKDPRTCLLLDFWLERYPQATLIAVYRHPLEVYSSIIRRQKLQVIGDEALIVDSWTAYNRAIARVWAGHRGRKFLVGTGAVFREPASLAEAICSRLGLPVPTATDRLPAFEAAEFKRLPIDRGAHACFSAAFPEAGNVFDQLQALADFPLELSGTDDPVWAPLRARISADPTVTRLALPTIVHLVSSELADVRERLFQSAVVTAIETSRANAEILRNHDALQADFVRHQGVASQNSAELTEWRARYLAAATRERARGRRVLLWGNNPLARRVAGFLAQSATPVSGVVDRTAADAMRPEEFFAVRRIDAGPGYWVVVCSRTARDEIAAELRDAGMNPDEDFVVLPTF